MALDSFSPHIHIIYRETAELIPLKLSVEFRGKADAGSLFAFFVLWVLGHYHILRYP